MSHFPIWSGINSHEIDAVEINGAAPTPPLITQGFSSAIIPRLIGSFPGVHFEVVYARHEQRHSHTLSEERSIKVSAEQRAIMALPEVRFAGSDRSHKTYPFRRVK